MADLLLDKGYHVVGMVRRSASPNYWRIAHSRDRMELVNGDLIDQTSLLNILDRYEPDEVYNLAAQSYVGWSWDQPITTGEVTGLGPLRLLEAIRIVNPAIRMYQASSSEMFGAAPPPQSESTPFHPRSPYGFSKVFAHYAAQNYRESYGMFVCSGILFNHESPRRGEEFVTRKISQAVAKIYLGRQRELRLGNLDARRDWGYAPEYMDAAWRMLQKDEPDDYVIATGRASSVRDFLETAFECAGLDWREYVVTDPGLIRPAEVDHLLGDASKARVRLGWQARVEAPDLAKLMVEADLDAEAV